MATTKRTNNKSTDNKVKDNNPDKKGNQVPATKPEPEKVDQEVKAKDVFKDVGKLTKQTGKKVWTKVKKPLKIMGAIGLGAAAVLVGTEVARQREMNDVNPPTPEDPADIIDIPEEDVTITESDDDSVDDTTTE